VVCGAGGRDCGGAGGNAGDVKGPKGDRTVFNAEWNENGRKKRIVVSPEGGVEVEAAKEPRKDAAAAQPR